MAPNQMPVGNFYGSGSGYGYIGDYSSGSGAPTCGYDGNFGSGSGDGYIGGYGGGYGDTSGYGFGSGSAYGGDTIIKNRRRRKQ